MVLPKLYCSDCLTLIIPFPANKVNLDPPLIGTSIVSDKIHHIIKTSKILRLPRKLAEIEFKLQLRKQ